jgi:hypothetical protein
MIGEKVTLEDIDKDQGGMVTLKNGKRGVWYEHYKFKDEEQYLLWRHWAIEEIKKALYFEDTEQYINYLDLRYGMIYNLVSPQQKGLLF